MTIVCFIPIEIQTQNIHTNTHAYTHNTQHTSIAAQQKTQLEKTNQSPKQRQNKTKPTSARSCQPRLSSGRRWSSRRKCRGWSSHCRQRRPWRAPPTLHQPSSPCRSQLCRDPYIYCENVHISI